MRSCSKRIGATAAPTTPGPVWTPSTGDTRSVSSFETCSRFFKFLGERLGLLLKTAVHDGDPQRRLAVNVVEVPGDRSECLGQGASSADIVILAI